VQLSFSVSGRGGIPAYSLSGATPVFQGDTSTVTSNQLGTVIYHLTAAQAGTATLTLNVNYETSVGCVEQPIYEFVSDTSPPFSVEVVERASSPTPTPTPILTVNECHPSAHDCPVGKECNCCCGTWVCMPPYLPCCALPCLSPMPTFTPTATPTCHPIVGLTDCEEDNDCVVVDQIDCCPCSSGGHQAAINHSKQDELSQQLEVCCAAAGVCLAVYQCEDNLAAICHSGTCTLVNTAGTPTPTPTPTRTALPCVGDCSGDGAVTVDEIVRMVNIALNGDTSASSCPGSDQWCSSGPVLGAVRIACLIDAVNNLLTGCPTPG
jgi:hypothetical protein